MKRLTVSCSLLSGVRCKLQVPPTPGSRWCLFWGDAALGQVWAFRAWFPQEKPLAGANSPGAVQEQSWVCCCHSRGRGSMETPERASLQAVSKQQDHRQYQGTYKARCEARIISIHLAKCFQSSFQSRLKENRVSIEQTKLICTYSTLLKKKLELSDCCLLLHFYFPLQQNLFFFLF